jgi:aerobic carbon-monoxide dehydrogenase large subunit
VRVVTLELLNNRVVVNSMEPRNAIADFDPASSRSEARISYRARTRVRAMGAVIMIFHDTSLPAAAMPRWPQLP